MRIPPKSSALQVHDWPQFVEPSFISPFIIIITIIIMLIIPVVHLYTASLDFVQPPQNLPSYITLKAKTSSTRARESTTS